MNLSAFSIKKRKMATAIILLNVLFPIFSTEGLIPWSLTIGCVVMSYKNIKNGEKIILKSFTYLLVNGLIVVSYNTIVRVIAVYVSKVFL